MCKIKTISIIAILVLCQIDKVVAQYNTLWIPDTLSGTTFNLTEKDTFNQILTGTETITGGINGSIWGPTMFFNKGDVVHINVTNKLNDTTTLHWHGMHLPAIMDGGPHQLIPPNTVWSPYWTVTNDAGTYWYHPHLDMKAEEQLNMGLGGFIIIRDTVENALALPRKYSVDDIPLMLTDRKFDASNQFVAAPYGDSMLTNGVVRAQYTVPAEVVRFRLLDAAIERSYNIGFSDNRTFYVITTDGGLLDTSVGVTRLLIHAGERYEILVNMTGQTGTSVDMKAYNSELPTAGVAGGENFPGGPFANALGHLDFNILHINVITATGTGITTVPHSLRTNTFLSSSTATLTRNLTISDSSGVPGVLGPNAFILNHSLFNINTINYHVPINNTEIWSITNSGVFGHPFHIHDVQFYVLSVNGAPAPAYQQGWKDVMFVPSHQNAQFITKFTDYSDSLHPYMFHCHIALHEDEGMMGQFVVDNGSSGISKINNQKISYQLFPNPAQNRLFVSLADPSVEVYYITIISVTGRTVMMLPKPELTNGIDMSGLAKGTYIVQLMDTKTKSISSEKFVKQ
jgi:FtsP/CotA-like multicopper oxidase with cupredoxin domain